MTTSVKHIYYFLLFTLFLITGVKATHGLYHLCADYLHHSDFSEHDLNTSDEHHHHEEDCSICDFVFSFSTIPVLNFGIFIFFFTPFIFVQACFIMPNFEPLKLYLQRGPPNSL